MFCLSNYIQEPAYFGNHIVMLLRNAGYRHPEAVLQREKYECMLDYARNGRDEQSSIVEAIHAATKSISNATTEKCVRQTEHADHPDHATMVCGC